MSASVIREVVPVDDEWHALRLSGDILHVDSRGIDYVELWALRSGGSSVRREFQVFGTGHPLPDEPVTHRGSVIVAGGALVWHLFERGV